MSDSAVSAEVELSAVRLAAMDLLARREHSRRELREKLQRRFGAGDLIDAAIEQLAEEHLQSDSRYAESYLRQRAERGYGPLRIRQEMRQRGIEDVIIREAFATEPFDWSGLASRAAIRKFGETACADLREKSRRLRFLQYRGFSADQCSRALE